MHARLLPVVLPLGLAAQGLVPEALAPLAAQLAETSGLLVVNGQVWTHGDSGVPNRLYRIEPATGGILREVVLSNTTNVDWEDVTADGQYVYVGDFGNNSGARTDLRIYRFPLVELLNEAVLSITVDTIRFAYADQVDFTLANQANNWDCEALIAKDDSLFLFTKNWLDLRSHLYVLPAEPGDHLALRRDTLEAMGLVTGADLDPVSGAVALIGYTLLLQPFVWHLSDFPGNDLLGGAQVRHDVALTLTQAEAIAWLAPDTVLLTNESFLSSPARSWKLHLGGGVNVAAPGPRPALRLVPNPAADSVRILGLEEEVWVTLRDGQGGEVLHRRVPMEGVLSLTGIGPGLYSVEVETGKGSAVLRLTVVR